VFYVSLQHAKRVTPADGLKTSSSRQTILCIYRIPNFMAVFTTDHPPLAPIPSQIQSLWHYFNVILPPTPRSSKWFFPLSLPHRNCVPACTSPQTHTCYVSCPYNSRFDHRNIGWGEQTIKTLRAGRYGDRIPVEARFFSHLSRPDLVATQLSIQWAPRYSRGYRGRGMSLTTHPLWHGG